MGQWNETCFISHRSIEPGEEVYQLVIRENPYSCERLVGVATQPVPLVRKGGNGCYAANFWEPICPPIRGKYDSYGGIKPHLTTEEDKAVMAMLMVVVYRDLVPLKIGSNPVHDIPIRTHITQQTYDQLHAGFQEGRLYHLRIKYGSTKAEAKKDPHYLPLCAVHIKASVWKKMLKLKLPSMDKAFTLASIRKDVQKDFSDVRKLEEAFKGDADFPVLHRTPPYASGASTNDPLFDFSIHSQVRDNCVERSAQFAFIHCALSRMRMAYAPTVGAGSQDDNQDIYRQVVEAGIYN